MWSKENIRALFIIIATAILSILGFRVVPMMGCDGCGRMPPAPPGVPPEDPGPQPNPLHAIGKCSRPGVGCSFTVIGPRRPDGRYDVVLAAHCCDKLREKWSGRLHNGQTLGFTIVNLNRTADYAWGVTDTNTATLPYALLASTTPPVGTKIWHAGFGFDNPGNREEGTIVRHANAEGQIEMRLNVSNGDSGGGIVIDADGRVVSNVCCSTGVARMSRVWGAAPEVMARGRVTLVDLDEWQPIPLPQRPEDFGREKQMQDVPEKMPEKK